MSFRTYLPTLLNLLRTTCRYIQKYRSFIEQFIGEENVALLNNVVTACEALEAALKVIIPPGQ
jgi:hypothetical protein